MGGMHGFGPVVRERDEPVFHADWERRTFALRLAVGARRFFNGDEHRHVIERMPPAQYLAASYYERWLYALENLLIEKGVVERAELDAVVAALRADAPSATAADGTTAGIDPSGKPPISGVAMPATASSQPRGSGARLLRHDPSFHPRFKAGDPVVARNINPEGHTRIPRYARGHRGTIFRDWGVFVFPDTHAHGGGAKPQHCYAVEFDSRELWGDDHPADERVFIDLWEDYLETAKADAPSSSATTRKNSAKSGAKGRAETLARKPATMKTASAAKRA